MSRRREIDGGEILRGDDSTHPTLPLKQKRILRLSRDVHSFTSSKQTCVYVVTYLEVPMHLILIGRQVS